MPACSQLVNQLRDSGTIARIRAVVGGAVLGCALFARASAHPAHGSGGSPDVWTAWSFEPLASILLVGTAFAYTLGVIRVWRLAGPGQGVRRHQVAAFGTGWLVMAVALIGPIDGVSDALFSVHMVQHELLMLVAAPLVAIGAPALGYLWALPRGARRWVGNRLTGRGALRALYRWMTMPATAWLLHAVAIWIWHVPALFDLAVRNEPVHAAQHLSVFGTALLFWWGLLRGRYGHLGYGAAVVYVFTTAMYTGALGALLTIASRPLYSAYAGSTAAWGLTALEDQQIGGLIMWVPAGILYTGVGLWLFGSWLRDSERRADLIFRHPSSGSGSGRRLGRIGCWLAVAILTLPGCRSDEYRTAAEMAGGDPQRGGEALSRYGCVTCHTIPGLREARGTVGPPLTAIANRTYLAGHLPNTPDNMITWIQHPRRVDPRTAMPDTGVTDADAHHIAAYLYTLR
jgi:putative membrane protein